MKTDCVTDRPNEYPQTLTVRAHSFHADVGISDGSGDSAPGSHDYFDAALASCKTLTAIWYAKRHGIALERADAHVERDDSREQKGTYVLRVKMELHGPLSEDDRARIMSAVARCPISKLMTTSDVVIETAPLDPIAP